MTFRVEHLKDRIGNNYLGIKVPNSIVDPYLGELKELLGEEYDRYVENQQKRDGSNHHITFINVMDYNKLCSDMGMNKFTAYLNDLFSSEFDDLKFMGIGKASKNDSSSYFVVVMSHDLQEVRKSLGLSDHDFHITLGFDPKDVFGVRKNQVLPKRSEFLKIISNFFKMTGENFDFIKDLNGYEYDKEIELEVIEINHTNMVFRVGLNDYFCVVSTDGSLIITNKWQDTQKRPILSNTMIFRKLSEK